MRDDPIRETLAKASERAAVRVAIYSHDTYGLGHLTRSARIARGIVQGIPGSSVLVLSGSPIAHRFSFAPGVDYIKLPSVVKAGPATYEARELGISRARIRAMRSQLVLDAVDYYRPHLLLVDNVPIGMRGELLPALHWLRSRSPDTRIQLNLRDVLDEPSALRATWRETGVYEVLHGFYDAFHVFGSPEIHDAIGAYGLPAERTHYLSYIAPAPEELREGTPLPASEPGGARVLVTAGGGGDGEEVLRCVAGLQRRLGAGSPFRFHVVTGPLMDERSRGSIAAAFDGVAGVTLHEYVEALPAWIAASDLVLSMGGYNTLCEVLALGRRSLVVPRVRPRREQEIRARAFEARGLLRMLHPAELTDERLETELRAALEHPAADPASRGIAFDGIAALQRRLREALAAPRGPREPPPASAGPEVTAHGGGESGAPRGRAKRSPESGATGLRARRRALRSFGRTLLRRLPPSLMAGLIALLATAEPARSDARPQEISLGFSSGYDSNLLDASDAERAAFEERSPDALFSVNRMDDAFLRGAVAATWGLGRPLGLRSKLRGTLERTQFLHNPIKSASSYELEIQSRLGRRTRLTASARHDPQSYGRHRRDKDARPGEPLFRAEVQRRWDLGLEWEQRLGEAWTGGIGLEGSWRDCNRPFDERDRRQANLDAAIDWEVGSALSLELAGGLRRSRSRNEPDLGNDLSYREWSCEPRVVLRPWSQAATLELSYQARWRSYTAEDPEDWNHYGRTDRGGELRAALARDIDPVWQAEVAFVHGWRRARLDSGQTVDYDEEGSFAESVVTSTITWRWMEDRN